MNRVSYYIDGRLFEWIITISMLWLAGAIFLDPVALRASAFHWIALVMSNTFIEIFLFSIGWTRLIGLLLNGHAYKGRRVGPIIRSVTAVFCAVMWVQFDLALIELSAKQGFMSPGIPFWSMFVVGELYVAYRAVGTDGRAS
jgi:hypothetical protein